MKQNFIFLAITLTIILAIYSISFGRQWQFFDERIITNESIFPIPQSLSELFEVIKTYAFTYNTDSENSFFSNIINVRSNTLGAILNILVTFFLKETSVYYRLLQTGLHLINTCLVWFIFFKLLNFLNLQAAKVRLYSSLASLVWSLHPTNIEAVQLATNWTSILTYLICFLLTFFIINKVISEKTTYGIFEAMFICLLYIFSLLISEYSYTLPFILFFVTLSLLIKKGTTVTKAVSYSTVLSKPLLWGLVVYVLFYFLKSLTATKLNLHPENYLNFSFERLFFLSPQIFLHFLALILFPKTLSLYQSNLVHISESYFTFYYIFSLLIFLFFVLAPFTFFLLFKEDSTKSYMAPLAYSFLFSIFPFCHIISPTYCLFAERYCYLPLFFFLVLIICLFKNIVASFKPWCVSYPEYLTHHTLTVLSIILVITISTRTTIRITEWKDTYSLYFSALKASKNSLQKGEIHSVLSYYLFNTEKKEEALRHAKLSIREFQKAIKKLNIKKGLVVPATLVTYGLDPKSLLVTSSFSISESRYFYLSENVKDILDFYEPIIKENLNYAGSSQLNLYAKLLLEAGKENEALDVLNFALFKFPNSPHIIYTLSNLHLKRGSLDIASRIIDRGYNLFPSYPRMLLRKIKISELKKDNLSLADYEYKLGLRAHSLTGYQKACQIYTSLKEFKKANKCFNKASLLDKNNPVTLFLKSKYYEVSGKKEEALKTLEEAYSEGKLRYLSNNLESNVFEKILLNLISYKISENNLQQVKRYVAELENLPITSSESISYISSVKKMFNIK